jgi:pyruvate/2-oxoglutarate dehydrogenase complex dihydrolipoamide acyltransferase (E2) component
MACCGKKEGVVNATPSTDFVSMTYLGSNTGTIRFDGFLKRSYRVVRGSVVQVHPDDVARLNASGKFIITPKQNTAVSTPPPVAKVAAPVAPAVAVAEPVTTGEIDATEGAVELATLHGIDLTTIKGTGAGGRIVLRDVKAVIGE